MLYNFTEGKNHEGLRFKLYLSQQLHLNLTSFHKSSVMLHFLRSFPPGLSGTLGIYYMSIH